MPTTETAQVLESWPQPGTGNAGPRIRTGNRSLVVAYPLPSEEVAVVEFPVCVQLTYGQPNDEALQSHPLYGKGLKFYSVHRIHNSSKLAALERANSIHPQHDAATFIKNRHHYVFTFQDATLECVVLAGDGHAPKIQVVRSWAEANAALAQSAA